MSDVLGIIPARAGSTRLPGKNFRPLGGKPLVARTIEVGLSCNTLDRLVVSSNDPEVIRITRDYDPALVLERPAEFATAESPAIEYVRHALSVLEAEPDARRFEFIAILQPSSPFALPADVDLTVRLLQDSGADSAVTVMPVDFALHPAKFKTLDGDRLLPYLEKEGGRMSAQQLPPIYVRNGSVYAARRHVIESGLILGEDCRGHVVPRERSVDINDEMDFRFAQFLLDTFGEPRNVQ